MKFHYSPVELIQSKAKLKLIKFLMSHDVSMSEREIASVLRISHMSVNRVMQELAQMNVVRYIRTGNAHLWQVNRKSYVYQTIKKMFNTINSLPEPLEELKRLVLKYLSQNFIRRIVLFGSVAKTEEKPDSDIDLFVLIKGDQNNGKIEEAIGKLSNECLEIFGNRLAPYILTEKQYRQKQSLEIISEVEQGIQFYPEKDAKI